MIRSSGILLPLSSLPSKYGIGTMGREAYKFIDFLEAANQRWWQVLPLGPTTDGYGNSPYSSPSTFAGNPYYIDLEMLVDDGLLERAEPDGIDWGSDPEKVEYAALSGHRLALLRKAFTRITAEMQQEIQMFFVQNKGWLANYALYMSLKEEFAQRSWTEWPEDIRRKKPEAVAFYSEKLRDESDFWIFVQYLFFKQWAALKAYAHAHGIGFIGDIPIYVAMDSADVWGETEFFQLDEDLVPKEVSGVPPDDYTEDGQLWGNPLYDWDRMRQDGFGWWIRRIGGAEKLFDVIRIDHFRGLADYWAVPYGEKTAKNGKWRSGPGMELVRVLTGWFNELEYIAEDLGCPTPEAAKLLADSRLPGMNVLQFGFDVNGDSAYMPHNIKRNSSCYIGTHDNDTALGWIDSLDDKSLGFLSEYIHRTRDESWCRALIRTGMAAPSRLFVMTMQDILELSTECRTNTPGTPDGNWRWRMLPGAAAPALAEELAHLTQLYRRAPTRRIGDGSFFCKKDCSD